MQLDQSRWMMGQDIQGMVGFHDKVDNHYKR